MAGRSYRKRLGETAALAVTRQAGYIIFMSGLLPIPSDYEATERLRQRLLSSYTLDSSTGCWLWSRSTNGSYGLMRVGAKGKRCAHRVAWTVFNGPIPNGAHILHRCDVKACINPQHLFLGSLSDNMSDMWSKNRHPGMRLRGMRAPGARLPYEDITAIRQSTLKPKELATMYNIHREYVYVIRSNKVRISE